MKEDLDVGSQMITSDGERQKPADFNFVLPAGSINNKTVAEDVSKYSFTSKLELEHTVSVDHCYARPWNWRPEASFLRPTKTLFFNKLEPGIRKSSNPLISLNITEQIIDVESEVEVPNVLYDVEKAKNMMEECQRYAFTARPDKSEEDWEEKISRNNWTTVQQKVFNNMVNILNSFKLAKLAYTSVYNEPLLRHNIIRKGAQRVRKMMASITWDQKLTQWLHQLLMDNLDPYYLACYLDILQALKLKLPTFVEKMIHSSSSAARSGPLSHANVLQVLDKSWEPVFSSLIQEKPKKLPGNPIIVVIPTSPVVPKMITKWIKLLSNLAMVVNVPTNFGSSGHRIGLPNCVDHLFSVSRGKIQDVRSEYPGRNIILVGFNAGATLALQLAQVEPVFCVISLGFSLLTADGRRGEPEDNLLELQCPVLFVIGQRSNTSFQEDMEDLRERMRVETGLIVVGSADDYLRVSKKRRKLEGITQVVVDKCIIDEVGDFISGLILSPYPPQIRQSPNIVPSETPIKKMKIERTRYNSNASSIDSEPPSPTPRITRPVGRPPGSKSKSRLEAKWAQQIAKGNTNDPTSPSTPNSPITPSIINADSSSNDISHNDKKLLTQTCKYPDTPIKKLKTLKPVASPNKSTTPMVRTPPHQARLQAYGMNRSIIPGTNLSTLLQGGIKTIPPSQPKASVSGIKVLENVTLSSTTTAKLMQKSPSDLAKSILNTSKGGNVFLLPDGKLKTLQGSTVKGTGGTPIILPLGNQRSQTKPVSRNKYITAKRQLMGQKPPRPVKTSIYMPSTSIKTSLPPPTNLTTQDIMELPIIFADDNKILEPSTSTNTISQVTATSTNIINTPVSLSTSKVLQTFTPGKFMLVNKPSTNLTNYVITPTHLKKQSPMICNKPTPKYTKIILSSKKHNLEELKPISTQQNTSQDLSVKKVLLNESIPDQNSKECSSVELIDLENEIKATAVPKPNINSDKYIMVSNKTPNKELVISKSDVSLIMKRPSGVLEGTDESDPDYIPPKNLKIQ